MVAGDAASYQYLVESIKMFPDQEAWAGVSPAEPAGAGMEGGHACVRAALRALRRRMRMGAARAPISPFHPGAATLPPLQMIEDAGFQGVDYENLTAGVVAIHSGFKMA